MDDIKLEEDSRIWMTVCCWKQQSMDSIKMQKTAEYRWQHTVGERWIWMAAYCRRQQNMYNSIRQEQQYRWHQAAGVQRNMDDSIVSPGTWTIPLFFVISSYKKNNWKPSFDFISVHGLDGTWKPRMAVYNPRMAIYFLSSLLFLSWGSVGRVLIVRSDYKYWVQMKGSSVHTCLPHRPVALLWFSPHHLHDLPSS